MGDCVATEKTVRLPKGALTPTAYARLRGVSHTAVQQRIAAGALPTSTRKIKGRWVIIDVDRANAEWDAHSRPWVGGRSARWQ
jgi:hypothetical protein